MNYSGRGNKVRGFGKGIYTLSNPKNLFDYSEDRPLTRQMKNKKEINVMLNGKMFGKCQSIIPGYKTMTSQPDLFKNWINYCRNEHNTNK